MPCIKKHGANIKENISMRLQRFPIALKFGVAPLTPVEQEAIARKLSQASNFPVKALRNGSYQVSYPRTESEGAVKERFKRLEGVVEKSQTQALSYRIGAGPFAQDYSLVFIVETI
jgi:hypothetical protein